MGVLETHRKDTLQIQHDFLRVQGEKLPLTLRSSPHPSNVTRAPEYKAKSAKIDINRLNRILYVDPIERIVAVEPRVTMEELARATLKYGMLVPVLPEFKGITVGGAIMGTGLESSSHAHGLFSDNALSYEVLLGDGSIVRASAEEHADLFYGIVGSYGSLGIILSVQMRLISVEPWVKLAFRKFHSMADVVRYFTHAQADFLEGFVFSKDNFAVVEGSFASLEEAENIPATFSQKFPWSQWFYSHVKESAQEEKMPLFDYLFRHDRGAFWMGSYGTQVSALPRYFLESRFKLKTFARLCTGKRLESGPKDPGLFYRLFLGWAMTSKRLYSWLHAHSEDWVRDRCIIQDFCIPRTAAASFVEAALSEVGVTPLWLCPIASVKHKQIFAPHLHPQGTPLINIGVYGIPFVPKTSAEHISALEAKTKAAQGRKMLYSYSYYSPEAFWEIYPKKTYEELRRNYHADAWTRIEDKVLLSY